MRNKILRSAKAKYHYIHFCYKINKGDLTLMSSCVFFGVNSSISSGFLAAFV